MYPIITVTVKKINYNFCKLDIGGTCERLSAFLNNFMEYKDFIVDKRRRCDV